MHTQALCVCLGNVDPGNESLGPCWCPSEQPLQLIPHFLGPAAPCPCTGSVAQAWEGWQEMHWGQDVWWCDSPGTGHSQSCPATLLPHSLGTLPFQCLPGSRFTAALSRSLLCCLPPLLNHIFNTRDGFAPSERDPCPGLQIPCEFLSWGSAQLWLLPVPLPYALAAAALLLFCTRPLCNKLDTESPISKFWGSIHKIWGGHSAIHQKKKKKEGKKN